MRPGHAMALAAALTSRACPARCALTRALCNLEGSRWDGTPGNRFQQCPPIILSFKNLPVFIKPIVA